MTATQITAPDGSLWQLVPEQPTPEMLEQFKRPPFAGLTLGDRYARMLAAAPEFGEGDVDGELNRLADALSQSARMYNEGRTTMRCVANGALDVAQRLRQLAAAPEFGGVAVACHRLVLHHGAKTDWCSGEPSEYTREYAAIDGYRIELAYTHPPAADEAMGRDAERWRHARHHALFHLLQAYPTPDTSDVGLDYAVDAAIAAMRGTAEKERRE